MADETTHKPVEPRGFGEHTRGLAGEYAHEQGWGLDEAERTLQPAAPQDVDGGGDYNYGARDFGDTPVNTAIDHTEDGAHRSPATQTTASKIASKTAGKE